MSRSGWLAVPRDAAGDLLHAGIRATIAGRDGVDVETVDVVALRPRLNDLTVTVDASIRPPGVEVDDLSETVGIHEASPVADAAGRSRSTRHRPTHRLRPRREASRHPPPNNTTMTRDHPPPDARDTPTSTPVRPRPTARPRGARRWCSPPLPVLTLAVAAFPTAAAFAAASLAGAVAGAALYRRYPDAFDRAFDRALSASGDEPVGAADG